VVEPRFIEMAEGRATATVADPGRPRNLQRLVSGWCLPPPPLGVRWDAPAEPEPEPEAVIEFSWASQTARHIGTIVHRMLQRIGQEGLEVWSAARISAKQRAYRAALASLGVPGSALDRATERVCEALLRTVEDHRGRWVLSTHEQAQCEFALSGVVNGRFVWAVMDRTFVEDGVRWVIDYKVGAHAGGHLEEFLDTERERYRAQLARRLCPAGEAHGRKAAQARPVLSAAAGLAGVGADILTPRHVSKSVWV
jgi:hypothetical protein